MTSPLRAGRAVGHNLSTGRAERFGGGPPIRLMWKLTS
ncbi:hypothetical protein I552_0425 [Mycobacterium xenopi 3993]|nr:hypothetical protein I552_0425 [Mycobacterium xenopi 3993]